ncbi:Uncharacterised protein [Enterobacter hormaechei]|nr:Uncharacterised protein [Enterobacter hormaechei]
MRIVSPVQYLRFILKFCHANHRAKHFSLDDRIFLLRPGQQRWLKVISCPLTFTATGDDADMSKGFGFVHGSTNAGKMRCGAERAQLG